MSIMWRIANRTSSVAVRTCANASSYAGRRVSARFLSSSTTPNLRGAALEVDSYHSAEEEPLPQPVITVVGVGGAGGNAVNNMITSHLSGVEFVVANTDAQALSQSLSENRIQLGHELTKGLGAGAKPDVGRDAAHEVIDGIKESIQDSHMVFITAGMGGGTGTGAAPVIASAARELGILTVGVVSKPFDFEGRHRMHLAEDGLSAMETSVDTLIVIPNQNLFSVVSPNTGFSQAFQMADHVLYSGVKAVTDLIVTPGLINLDFADVRAVMKSMGRSLMGTGVGYGDNRAQEAAMLALSNPLLGDVSIEGAEGVLISISGGHDLSLFEVDEISRHIRDSVSPDANIIFGSTFDGNMEGRVQVSVIVTGLKPEDETSSSNESPSLFSRPSHRKLNRPALPTESKDDADKPKKKKGWFARNW